MEVCRHFSRSIRQHFWPGSAIAQSRDFEHAKSGLAVLDYFLLSGLCGVTRSLFNCRVQPKSLIEQFEANTWNRSLLFK